MAEQQQQDQKHTTPQPRGVRRYDTVPYISRTKMAGLNAKAVLPIDASIRGANIKTVRHQKLMHSSKTTKRTKTKQNICIPRKKICLKLSNLKPKLV